MGRSPDYQRCWLSLLNITKRWATRHLLAALLIPMLALELCWSSSAQSTQTITLTEQDVRDIVATHNKVTPAENVTVFRHGMPPPASNEQFRASIHKNLPAAFTALKIDDDQLIAAVRRVLHPVLALYGREQLYDIVIIRHPTPLMMSDSGVVLLLSTGMIEDATSDDELLGYAAHEVGHEYFVYYSVEARQLLHTVSTRGNELVLRRKLAEVMAIIELQCDAFAALTLTVLKYNPLEFARGLERVEAKYPNNLWAGHPDAALRRTVIEGVTPSVGQQTLPHASPALMELKALIVKYRLAAGRSRLDDHYDRQKVLFSESNHNYPD